MTNERLLAAVLSEAQLFSYPWRYPFVLFEAGPKREDLTPLWRQNGQALVGGSRWGQRWGAAAIAYVASQVERYGERFDLARIRLGLEVGVVTRPDNATYLREVFGDRPELLQAVRCFEQAAQGYQAVLDAIADGIANEGEARQIATWLRQVAQAEGRAGAIFLAQAWGGQGTGSDGGNSSPSRRWLGLPGACGLGDKDLVVDCVQPIADLIQWKAQVP